MKRLILALLLTCTPAFADPQDSFKTVFTPDVSGTDTYINWLDVHARHDLYIADYTYSNQDVTDKLCELAKNGVKIHMILDKTQSKSVKTEKNLIKQLQDAGVEVTITTSPKGAIMHNKFASADGQWVIDGSWNITKAADKQSNTINFNTEPSPERAGTFLDAWQEIKDYADGHQAQNHDNGRRRFRHN